jgi:hypothetical protein
VNDPLYLGHRMRRLKGAEHEAFTDELMAAVADKWPHCIVQFEDFRSEDALQCGLSLLSASPLSSLSLSLLSASPPPPAALLRVHRRFESSTGRKSVSTPHWHLREADATDVCVHTAKQAEAGAASLHLPTTLQHTHAAPHALAALMQGSVAARASAWV